MRKPTYDAATRTAIIESVLTARKAGTKWKGAHETAKKAGYKGRLGGLVQFMRGAAKHGRKRRGGRRAKPMVAQPPPRESAGDIADLVENLVKARVKDAIEGAIKVLRQIQDA